MAEDSMTYISLTLNGQRIEVEVEPRQFLVEFVRNVARQTGTHIGCDTSYCGACTVLVDGRSVKSCTMFAVQADGTDVRTVESLEDKNGELNALQRAFANNHALQCGYCTPGFLMSATQLLARNANPSEADVRKGLSGNVCRCTGYQGILAAVLEAAAELRGENREV